ncbi:MAG: hypothetical protein Q4E99_03880, partial [Bacillota bacterium]|nr:hypothetical protein [Bacillota bacterium]
MITIDNKTYRNIQEQVQKNKEDIAAFKSAEAVIADFGITVLGHVNTVEEIPSSSYTYGNAYLVGTETPYDIYIYTRTDVEGEGEFINLGPLAVEGPKGDQGEQGPEGPQGQRGSQIYAGTDSPTSTGAAQDGDIYIRTGSTSNAGQLFRYEDNDWKYKGSVRGPQGPQGTQGLMGPRGYTGDVGPKGDKGDPGQ